jgi:hypothetical protein
MDRFLLGAILKEVRDGKLYKAQCSIEDRVALVQLGPDTMMSVIDGELGRRDVTSDDLAARTPVQHAARVLLREAHVIIGNGQPRPESPPDLYYACAAVDQYHVESKSKPRIALVPNREIREPIVHPQRVYFIQAEGTSFVKIGTSQGHVKRLSGMQTGCPLPLLLLGTCPGGTDEEFEIHKRFAHLRERGEWFRLEPELQDFIAREAV